MKWCKTYVMLKIFKFLELLKDDVPLFPHKAATNKDPTVLPDMTSEEDEVEEVVGDTEKLMLNNEERRMYTADNKGKRSVRRKTHSPKRVQQKVEMPILDERYAASLLEYYSKHKPYYPGTEADMAKTMEVDNLKVRQ